MCNVDRNSNKTHFNRESLKHSTPLKIFPFVFCSFWKGSSSGAAIKMPIIFLLFSAFYQEENVELLREIPPTFCQKEEGFSSAILRR